MRRFNALYGLSIWNRECGTAAALLALPEVNLAKRGRQRIKPGLDGAEPPQSPSTNFATIAAALAYRCSPSNESGRMRADARLYLRRRAAIVHDFPMMLGAGMAGSHGESAEPACVDGYTVASVNLRIASAVVGVVAVLSILPSLIGDVGRAELTAIAIAIAIVLAATASFFGNLIGAGIAWLACVFMAYVGWWGLDRSMCHLGRREPPSHLDAGGLIALGVFAIGVVSAGLLASRSSRRYLMSCTGPLGFSAPRRRRRPGRSAARPAARFPAVCILVVTGLSTALAVPAFLNRHYVSVALLGLAAVAVSLLAIRIRMRGEVVRRGALSLCAAGICGGLAYASLREIPPGGFCRYDQYTWSSFFPGPALIILPVIAMTLLPETPEVAVHESGNADHA